MAWEQMAQFDFTEDRDQKTVKLKTMFSGSKPKRWKPPKCKKDHQRCVFRSEVAVIITALSLKLSFWRVDNELACDWLKEYKDGFLRDAYIYISEPDRGGGNSPSNTDLGFMIDDPKVIEADVSGGVCYATLKFKKENIHIANF